MHGYTKIVQYGDRTVVYKYEKTLSKKRKKHQSALQKKRQKQRDSVRSDRSLARSKRNFFRLVYTNVYENKELPTFITLTTAWDIDLTDGYKYLYNFFKRVKRLEYEGTQLAQNISYIGVPEWQKKSGRLHYHCLVWGLPKRYATGERSNRVLQRLWRKGFVDVRNATYKSGGLAGYLAKYFSKSQTDRRLNGRRAYSSSRNIKKVREHGSNSLSNELPLIVDNSQLQDTTSFETMWLGRCTLLTYKRNIKAYEIPRTSNLAECGINSVQF